MRKEYSYSGKLCLSGEYLVLHGAKCLAVPTSVGQNFILETDSEGASLLDWQAIDHLGNCWLQVQFTLPEFKIVRASDVEMAERLKHILTAHEDLEWREQTVQVRSYLNYPRQWGLGSSSSLICFLADVFHISAVELLEKTYKGSGYDIACLQAATPILYQRLENATHINPIEFRPTFRSHLYFLYLGHKQNTQVEVENYRKKPRPDRQHIECVSQLTDELVNAKDLVSFEWLLREHEQLVGSHLKRKPLKQLLFQDYWGEVKSLGAWGGDFAMVTSQRDPQTTREYFEKKQLQVFIPFDELIQGRRHV